MAKPALGKGLGALFGENTPVEQINTESNLLPIAQIESCATQPRKYFDEEALADLANSIREHGIIQPLIVRKLDSGYYQIIAGERRWRAARMAGLSEVPTIVIDADDRKAMELALIENLQRRDLNPIEEAEGYHTLMDSYHMTQEETATRVGKSRSVIANALRLLSLMPEVRTMVQDGRLSNGHGRALLALTAHQQKEAANLILENGLSVRQTETLVKKMNQPEKADNKPKDKENINYVDYAKNAANQLTEMLGRGCRIVAGRKKGRIELEYYSIDDLNDLLDALNRLNTNRKEGD